MTQELFISTMALATIFTIVYTVLEDAVPFSSGIAAFAWMILAFSTEITIISGGEEIVHELGLLRWLFAGLSMLSFMAFIGSVLGYYPADEQDLDPQEDTNVFR